MGVLMHRASEKFVELLEFFNECSGSDGALVAGVF